VELVKAITNTVYGLVSCIIAGANVSAGYSVAVIHAPNVMHESVDRVFAHCLFLNLLGLLVDLTIRDYTSAVHNMIILLAPFGQVNALL